jgi:sugar phosphate isomerase/epimerase
VNLTISNIAWTAEQDEEVLGLLRQDGVQAVELAPTRIWPEWQGTAQEAIAYRDYLNGLGLACSSLQAILYGLPHLKVFGTAQEKAALVEHLRGVADLAAALGAGPMVFGAPKNRLRGDRNDATAFVEAVELFEEIGDYCQQKGVTLCLEPNPTDYGCDFITTSEQGAALVREVNSPGFRLHLDAAGMHLTGDQVPAAIESAADVLAHIHISEPFLGDFEQPQVDHKAIAKGLTAIGWDQWISIEMRATDHPVDSVKTALATVQSIYQDL